MKLFPIKKMVYKKKKKKTFLHIETRTGCLAEQTIMYHVNTLIYYRVTY